MLSLLNAVAFMHIRNIDINDTVFMALFDQKS
jgi:hypothetical protein